MALQFNGQKYVVVDRSCYGNHGTLVNMDAEDSEKYPLRGSHIEYVRPTELAVESSEWYRHHEDAVWQPPPEPPSQI